MKNMEIQRLRGIACILILLGHLPIQIPNILLHGYPFVSLFLTFTGYFATIGFLNKYSNENNSFEIIREEFVRKFFRFIPLMYIWILIYFMVGNLTIYLGGQYGDMDRWYNELRATLLLNYNYYLAGLNIGGLFGQYWTLFVEIHFHILLVLLFVIFRSEKYRKVIAIFLVVATIFIFRPLTNDHLVRFVTHAQLDSVFGGVLIALCKNNKRSFYHIEYKFLKRMIGLILIVILLLSGWLFDTYYNNMNIKYPVFTALSCAILFFAIDESGMFSYGKYVNCFLEWAGNASASTYVSHIILYSCIYYNLYYNTNIIPTIIKTTKWGVFLQVITLIMVALFVGKISYSLIEKPYIIYSKGLLKRSTK